MNFRPYHNPQNADESMIPEGWRLLYADEFPLPPKHGIPCRLFVNPISPLYGPKEFSKRENCRGDISVITYIVPISWCKWCHGECEMFTEWGCKGPVGPMYDGPDGPVGMPGLRGPNADGTPGETEEEHMQRYRDAIAHNKRFFAKYPPT